MLKAFVAGETQFSALRVMREYEIGSPGNIKRAVEALEDAGVLSSVDGKLEFTEPYFRPLFLKTFNR